MKYPIVNVGTVGHIDHDKSRLSLDIESNYFQLPRITQDLEASEARVRKFWADHPEYKEAIAQLTSEYEHEFLYGSPAHRSIVFCAGPAIPHPQYDPAQFARKPKKQVKKLLLDGTPRSFFQLFE